MYNIKALIGILTVSDSCYSGSALDASGNRLEELLLFNKQLVPYGRQQIVRALVPDQTDLIQSRIIDWCDNLRLQLIITTGGTGISHRDVTPDATRNILHKELPLMSAAMLLEGLKHTPNSMLSRMLCGTRDSTLIINMPGSSKAVEQCYTAISTVLQHALQVLSEDLQNIAVFHSNIYAPQPETVVTPPSTPVGSSRSNTIGTVNISAQPNTFPMIDTTKALEIISFHSQPLSAHTLPLDQCVGSALAQDIKALRTIPPLPCSMKDGFAIRSVDNERDRLVIGSSLCGTPYNDQPLSTGMGVYITTGAPLPAGADAIVMVEHTEVVERQGNSTIPSRIRLTRLPSAGQDVREVGSDLKEGQVILKRGQILQPADIGIFASTGYKSLSVYKRPLVAVFSTGDELVDINSAGISNSYEVIDTNRPVLLACLRQDGYEVLDLGIVKDDPGTIVSTLNNAFSSADVIVSTGGMSMGDRDYIKPCLSAIGCEILFGKLKMKPGKPTCFAILNSAASPRKYAFGLPGNPISARVTYHLFVRSCLQQLSGKLKPYLERAPVTLSEPIKLDSRAEYRRVGLEWRNGRLQTISTGGQQSSRLMSLRGADALLELPASKGPGYGDEIAKGTTVQAVLFNSLISS